MRLLRFCFFSLTAGIIVSLYVVAPMAISFRSVLSGLLLPFAAAAEVTVVCAVCIVAILRRAAPFVRDSKDLLTMPVLPDPGTALVDERRAGHVVVLPAMRNTLMSASIAGSGPGAPGSIQERPGRPVARPVTARPRGRHRSHDRRDKVRAV
jgi:hypothetical protein